MEYVSLLHLHISKLDQNQLERIYATLGTSLMR